LKKRPHKLVDGALENIPHDYVVMGTGPNVKSIWDFVYGYEYGCIVTGLADYYRFKLLSRKGYYSGRGEIYDQPNTSYCKG
jgi:hypothetical protein